MAVIIGPIIFNTKVLDNGWEKAPLVRVFWILRDFLWEEVRTPAVFLKKGFCIKPKQAQVILFTFCTVVRAEIEYKEQIQVIMFVLFFQIVQIGLHILYRVFLCFFQADSICFLLLNMTIDLLFCFCHSHFQDCHLI